METDTKPRKQMETAETHVEQEKKSELGNRIENLNARALYYPIRHTAELLSTI